MPSPPRVQIPGTVATHCHGWRIRDKAGHVTPSATTASCPSLAADRTGEPQTNREASSCRAARGTARGPRGSRLDLAAALELRVQLGAEKDGDVRDPEPHQEDDYAAERAVGLVVGAEVGDVEGERGGRDDPDQHRDDAARADPAELRMLHVRRRPVEEREHEADERDQDRPLRDVPDVTAVLSIPSTFPSLAPPGRR